MSALDPVTIGGVIAVLGAVAALASWLPARRAARVDPLDRDARRLVVLACHPEAQSAAESDRNRVDRAVLF